MIRCPKFLLPALLVGSTACGPEPQPGSASGRPADAAPSAGPSNRIEIPVTVRDNLGITFAEVELRQVAQTLRVPGAFELQPRARHEYRMALPGRVELLVDQYERVEPGTPLFRYQSPAWPELLHEIILGEQAMETEEAEIRVGRARLEEAQARLAVVRERIEALARADFKKADLELQAAELEASLPRLGAEIELAETRLANAGRTRRHALHRAATASGFSEAELEAEVAAADDTGDSTPRYLTIDWIEVRAQDGGVVEVLEVTDGAFVEPPGAVLSTVDPEKLRFRALALQADLPRILQAREARIVPPRSPGIPAGESLPATMAIGLEAHPEERTVTLIAVPQATADWVRPGVSAFLEVVLDSTEAPALAIPRSSIVQDGLQYVFFRRDPNDSNKAIRVEADMGVSDGKWVVLHSGVMRGDQVVLAGVYELKLATQQRTAAGAGGHVHADGSVHDEH